MPASAMDALTHGHMTVYCIMIYLLMSPLQL